MKEENYVVFCVDGRKYRRPGYAFFMHEADVMMAAVAGEVASKKLSPSEGREVLEQYRDVLPPLFTGEQRMVFDPGRSGWDDPKTFPRAEAVLGSPQASQILWYEADELGIEGVELAWSSPFPVLGPISEEALDELRKAMNGRYEIIVKDTLEDYDAMGNSVEWAGEMITASRNPGHENQDEAPDQPAIATETLLVYGYDGQSGLVFLGQDYACDVRDFRTALYRAGTWGELREMVSGERYLETVEAWMETEKDRLLDEAEDDEEPEVASPKPDDDFDAEEIRGYSDGDWPEMTQRTMMTWVAAEIVSEYGHYAETIFNGFYPVIDVENGEKVVALLQSKGYACVNDEDLVWKAIWGG